MQHGLIKMKETLSIINYFEVLVTFMVFQTITVVLNKSCVKQEILKLI